MNKMKEVAKLFNKKLDEEFVLSVDINLGIIPAHSLKRRKEIVFNPRFGWTTEYTDDLSEIPEHCYEKCKITTKGLLRYNSYYKCWQEDKDYLLDLLTGRAVIIDE